MGQSLGFALTLNRNYQEITMSIILDISQVDMEFNTPSGSFVALKNVDLKISRRCR